MIDPPSGWMYGFPKVIPEGAKIAEFLRDNGYPKGDIDFAVRWIRMWYSDGDEQVGPQGTQVAATTQPHSEGPTDAEVRATSDTE